MLSSGRAARSVPGQDVGDLSSVAAAVEPFEAAGGVDMVVEVGLQAVHRFAA